ncbi:MAG: hypothetical protein FWC39_04430 [Bacteroidetes bacterium]|nr:hypothetical protein [Bacteroidota bacterium]
MGLDLHFFKNGVNIQKIREDIDSLYTKRRAIEDEIEQLEDARTDAELASLAITHNLNKMAEAVGLYEVLWRPEEIGITSAHQMIAPLEKGIGKLETSPEKYKTFNPSNGWGTYDDLLRFCKSTLDYCRQYPDAVIEASR